MIDPWQRLYLFDMNKVFVKMIFLLLENLVSHEHLNVTF